MARTGRLSSDAPNLHNIPVRSDEGRQFRKAFVPAPGFELLVADYNQIELRCIAHLADDPGLIAASKVAPTSTRPRRRGCSTFPEGGHHRAALEGEDGLVRSGVRHGGLRARPAAEHPDRWSRGVSSARTSRLSDGEGATWTTVPRRASGYTETLFGRRRQIPELSSCNFRIRQAGERQAMNAGIQGLAADIFKVALVRLDRAQARGRRD